MIKVKASAVKRAKPKKSVKKIETPDPKRPQIWLTKHPFDESMPEQLDVVYPNGDYEFYIEQKDKFHKSVKYCWGEPDKNLDTFVANL